MILIEIQFLSSTPARNRETAIEPLTYQYLVIKLHGEIDKRTSAGDPRKSVGPNVMEIGTWVDFFNF